MGGSEAGVHAGRDGYALTHVFYRDVDERPDEDRIFLSLLGAGSISTEERPGRSTDVPASHCLDAWTDGTATESTSLAILPDLPETEENEQAVLGLLLAETDRIWIAVGCYRQGCPLPIRPGDTLQIGVTAQTGEGGPVVEVHSDSGPPVVVEVGRAAP